MLRRVVGAVVVVVVGNSSSHGKSRWLGNQWGDGQWPLTSRSPCSALELPFFTFSPSPSVSTRLVHWLSLSLSHSLSLPPVELSQSHTHTHRRFCAWFFHLTFISPHPALLFLHFFQPFAYCLLRLSSSSIVAITVKSASRSVSKSDWLISHSFNCPLVDARWVCVHYQWTDYYYYFYYYFPESC